MSENKNEDFVATSTLIIISIVNSIHNASFELVIKCPINIFIVVFAHQVHTIVKVNTFD